MNKTNRQIIQEAIVEDFEIYKQLHEDFNVLIRTLKEDYDPIKSFDEFCIRLLNHFEGIDDEYEEMTKSRYINRIYKAIVKLSIEELNDENLINTFEDIIKIEK